MYLTIADKEGHCGVIHGGIPNGGACPAGGGAHNIGDDQYPRPDNGVGVLELWPGGGHYPARGGGDQYLAGGGDGHVKGCSTAGDPPHIITGTGPV
jgi:hypothetical protein